MDNSSRPPWAIESVRSDVVINDDVDGILAMGCNKIKAKEK